MVRLLALLPLVAGCYRPTVVAGSPCDTDEDCPRELSCVAQHCGGTDLPADATVDTPAFDAPPDGTDVTMDAPTDAPVVAMWSAPTPVPGVNTSSQESDPSWTPDRLTIVFSSTRLNGSEDIFIGTRATTSASFTVSPIAILNTVNRDEHSPEISADGLTLYFTSDRTTANNFDVYVSTRVGATWSSPTLVTELTTSFNDNDVAISPDGLTAVTVKGSQFTRSTRATTSAPWGSPVSLGSAVFGTSPASPSLTASGDIYLHADTSPSRNLYIARKNGTGFLQAVPITELNTVGRDAAPFISGDEKNMVFDRDDDIYESTHP